MTEYLRPADLNEALAARAAHPDWMVLAGGTDLMVSANHKAVPAGILDLWRLDEIGGVYPVDGAVRLGAGATWLEVQRDPMVQKHFAILVAAAKEIGALQIQARGTVGGNIGNSSPVGDSLPVFLALDAQLVLARAGGARRTVAYSEFCTGYRKTVLAADELIVEVLLPLPGPNTRHAYRKVGTRRAQSISKVLGAAAFEVEGDVVTSARVGFGAVADRPIRVTAVEAAVAGKRLGPEASEAARTAMRAAIKPIDDVRSTADYRHEVAENLVARFFMS